jgi:glucokinase
VNLLDPDLTVIAGGLSQIGETLFNGMRAEVTRRMINPFAADTPIVPAKLASHGGVLGAASGVRQAIQ